MMGVAAAGLHTLRVPPDVGAVPLVPHWKPVGGGKTAAAMRQNEAVAGKKGQVRQQHGWPAGA